MKKRDKICFAISFAGIAILILALLAMYWTDLQPEDLQLIDERLEKYRLFCISYVIITVVVTPLILYGVFKDFKEAEQDKSGPKWFVIISTILCEFVGGITLTNVLLAIGLITHMLGVYWLEMLIKCISSSEGAIMLMMFLGGAMVISSTFIQNVLLVDDYDY